MANLTGNQLNVIVISNATTCAVLIIIAIAMDFTNRRILKKKEDTQANRNRSRSVSTSSNNRKTGEELLLYFTHITLFLFLSHTICKSLVRLEIHPNTDYYCTWWAKANVVLWHLARLSLFFILVFRVHIIFKGSCYEYKKYIIYPLYAFILGFCIFVITMDFVVINGEYQNNIHACSPVYPLWGIVVSGGVDFILNILTLILFIIPLVKLNKLQNVETSINMTTSNSQSTVPTQPSDLHTQTSSVSVATPTEEASPSPPPTPRPAATSTLRPASPRGRGRSRKSTTSRPDGLSDLIVRYALLVIIAIGSTLISYVTAFLGNWMTDISSPIDNAINVWCIVLINGVNQKVYNKLCGICHNGIKSCGR